MIGKPEWFQRRKYTGWGLTPATWQGWVYILVLIGIFVGVQSLPIPAQWRMYTMIGLAVVFGIDFLDRMIHLKKDEREQQHEAIAERNAAWVMVLIIGIGVAYEAASSVVRHGFAVDPWLLAAVIGGVLAKMISNIYLEYKS